MTRLSLYAVLAAFVAGPWGGCERDPVTPEPVTPPATPPTERARSVVDDTHDGFDGAVLLDDLRRRG